MICYSLPSGGRARHSSRIFAGERTSDRKIALCAPESSRCKYLVRFVPATGLLCITWPGTERERVASRCAYTYVRGASQRENAVEHATVMSRTTKRVSLCHIERSARCIARATRSVIREPCATEDSARDSEIDSLPLGETGKRGAREEADGRRKRGERAREKMEGRGEEGGYTLRPVVDFAVALTKMSSRDTESSVLMSLYASDVPRVSFLPRLLARRNKTRALGTCPAGRDLIPRLRLCVIKLKRLVGPDYRVRATFMCVDFFFCWCGM